MAKTHKTVIGEIKKICDHTIDDDGTEILEQIQRTVNKQLGYAFTV